MKKIVIYGAGQIGTCVMAQLMTADSTADAEVVMYSPHNHSRVAGAELDLEDACALQGRSSSWHFKATDDVADLSGADVVVVSAGGCPTPEDYKRAAEQGIDDRLVQAMFNIDIMKQFAKDMKNSPKATIFVLSNPVDVLCNVVRNLLPKHQVYGLGCWLDTARFKRELWELLKENGNPNLQLSDVKATIIGHHNGTMFVHEPSVEVQNLKTVSLSEMQKMVEQALDKTKGRGLFITNTNAQATTKKLNNGSYWAPAMMVSSLLRAFVKGEATMPLNRQILSEESKELAGSCAQLLCRVGCGTVVPVPMKLTQRDVANLKNCLTEYSEGMQKLQRFISK